MVESTQIQDATRGLFFCTYLKGKYMAWYTLQTNPNYEAKVIAKIEEKRVSEGLEVREIFCPEQTIVEYKDGKAKERKRRLYTNYIFLELDYEDKIWHSLRGIRGVVGFLGNRNTPTVLPESEIDIMKKLVSGNEPQYKIEYELDSNVRITKGSFASFIGKIKKVEYEKNRAVVLLNIFNRETEVEIDLADIEKDQ